MKKICYSCLLCLAVVCAVFTGQAQAAYTWEAHGTAADGRPDNGQAVFTFSSPTSLSITLTNTADTSQLGGISSVLDGLAFTLSGTPASITLTSASARGTVTASNGLTFNDPTGGIKQTASNPFGWTMQLQSGTWQLLAGNGSFKPDGIVNHNITATDGLTNAQHNPFLDGPVTFNFNVTGLTGVPQVTSANFYFGTTPDIKAGSASAVPLPSAVLLLAPGLLGLAAIRRRPIRK